VLGAALALVVVTASGRLDGDDDAASTVVVTVPTGDDAPAAVRRPVARNGFDPARVYSARAPGVVTIYALFGDHAANGQASQGSGFVVSRQGVVLTSAHVVTTAGQEGRAGDAEPASETFVEFSDGDRARAEIVGWDLFNDTAVLRVDPASHALKPVPLGVSARVRVGDPVAAIGSPFGEVGSLAVGVVSATGRSIASLTSRFRIVDAIQIDAPINSGNSGGPLLDAAGRVIGINAQIRSTSGTAEGVGFAVPIDSARRSLRQLLEQGRVSYAFVGISADNLTPRLARRLGYGGWRGALVVTSEGPARDAGIRGAERTVTVDGRSVRSGGDLIVGVGGRPVRSADELVRIVSTKLVAGSVVTFSVLRDGRVKTVRVRLGERAL
jgi:S1-C subfamily serine protease